MTRDNIELVRTAFDAWNAGDMDALRDLYAPDVTSHAPPGWPEPGPFIGRDAVMREFEQVREAWDADAIDLVSDIVTVDDRAVVRLLWRGVGRGPESNVEMTNVFTIRAGKICEIIFAWDHAEALRSVGLPG